MINGYRLPKSARNDCEAKEREIDQLKPCKKCKGKARIVCVDDCYYARCTKCTKWPPYEFLGVSPAAATRNWNKVN